MLDSLPILFGALLGAAFSIIPGVQRISNYIADAAKRASLSVPVYSERGNAKDEQRKAA